MRELKFRWSDGMRWAVEFTCASPDDMEQSLQNALIDFRRTKTPYRRRSRLTISHEDARAELHVQVAPNRWTDLRFPNEHPIEIPSIGGKFEAGYVHIINLPHLKPDSDGLPKVRGTDRVLVIGPGAWHGPAIYTAALAAIGYYDDLGRIGPNVVMALRYREDPCRRADNEE